MYNGYKNRETWNVCLWISNDEGLNEFASGCIDYAHFKDSLRQVDPDTAIAYETPDQVAWNDSGIDLDKMKEFWDENFSKART